jgi:aspartyl-tRNA(Asn)/glutamyl-tRNA(Gln) amidotransferase subunit A
VSAVVAANDDLNAFLAVPPEPGAGVSLGVKDLFDTAGLTTTYGSAIFRDHVPAETAPAVAQLEAAGYSVVAKTNLHEFAYGITSANPHYGAVVNPLDRSRIPGGSSGGSAAAVAAGLCEVALGTDSAGSIRIPAACCGIVGFKPSHGLVLMEGCWPLAPSYDTGGPMTRDVAACVAMMEALVPGFAATEVETADLAVGLAWVERADPLVRARVEAAASLFPQRRALDLPLLQEETHPVFMREAADVHGELFAEHANEYGDNVRTKIERCLAVTDAQYEAARAAREQYVEDFAAVADGVDLVLAPTLECVAPPIADDLVLRERAIRLTYPLNTVGWPALALPCGPAEAGLPASVSLAAPRDRDAYVLGAGLALEAALSANT